MFLYDDLRDLREPAAVFGMYPRQFIAKIAPVLGVHRSEILHICSGALRRGDGIRVDVRRDAQPDIVADGRQLPFRSGSARAVLIDPPYTQHYARELYGTDYPRPSHLLREAARVIQGGGRIGFVHYITPNPPTGCDVVRVFGLSVGFGYPMRAVTIFEKRSRGIFDG